MNQHTYHRRQTDQGPKWNVKDPDGKVVALCETEDKAFNLKNDLCELRELRILLAVASKTLARCQACAILRCEEKDLDRKIHTCLAKGYR